MPSDCLKQIIQEKPTKPNQTNKTKKIFDKSDPRVYDTMNYDINSFKIQKGHICKGTEIGEYLHTGNIHGTIQTMVRIQLEFKLLMGTRKRCVWDHCNKTTNTLCNNEGCKKHGCIDHLLIICIDCFSDTVIKNSNIPRKNLKDNLQKRCATSSMNCWKTAKLVCACCTKHLCSLHRYYLCTDCSGIHSNSDSRSIFSHKFRAKKIHHSTDSRIYLTSFKGNAFQGNP